MGKIKKQFYDFRKQLFSKSCKPSATKWRNKQFSFFGPKETLKRQKRPLMTHDMFYVNKTNVNNSQKSEINFLFFLQKTHVEEKL